MRRVIALTVLMCILIACGAPAAHGWSAGGHKVIANIAYDRLDADIRKRVIKVLRAHEDFDARFSKQMPEAIHKGDVDDQDRWIFMQASVWPDLIRSDAKYDQPTWHYINVPYFLTSVDKDALKDAVRPNLDLKLPNSVTPEFMRKFNCVQAFKYSLAQLSDAKVTDEAKAI